jgi:hypothetical protein
MERQYWHAMKEKDANAAMELTDDQCVVAGASGVASIGDPFGRGRHPE